MLDDVEEAPCGRCRRFTPVEDMRLWTTRERVRTLSRPPASASAAQPEPAASGVPAVSTVARPSPPGSPAFRYATVTRADAVCAGCHARLARGAALDGPERRRTWLVFAAFIAIAALLVWGVPAIMPNLIAAFWRNGAGGR